MKNFQFNIQKVSYFLPTLIGIIFFYFIIPEGHFSPFHSASFIFIVLLIIDLTCYFFLPNYFKRGLFNNERDNLMLAVVINLSLFVFMLLIN